MRLATSDMIKKIDSYSQNELGITVKELMKKSGEAVAAAIRKRAPKNKDVVILAGKGNNGADGYAAATMLQNEYSITVYDIFGTGQTSHEGKQLCDLYISGGGHVVVFAPTPEILSHIKNAGCIVDAVFGTGFHGEMPESIRPLAIAIRESAEAQKIAIDVPLGIDADKGSVSEFAISVGATVELCFIKPGIISYPARSYVGEIIYDDLGLPRDVITSAFDFRYHMIDKKWALENLPEREENSNKGTFGKALLITGSTKYRGAAHLGVEAALRGGVGLVNFASTEPIISELSLKYPEVIYTKINDISDFAEADITDLINLSARHSATLIGSGSDNTQGLLALVLGLLRSEGGPIILDADAINALSTLGEEGQKAIRESKRDVVITPHPLEFARLSGIDVSEVQRCRIAVAEDFALKNSCTVVLKGAGTIITDGKETYINAYGSSALAKAGSGDVLAGLVAAFIAQKKISVLNACALAVYYHARAGESLAQEYSSYGVTPSDLPTEIARQIAQTEKERKKP